MSAFGERALESGAFGAARVSDSVRDRQGGEIRVIARRGRNTGENSNKSSHYVTERGQGGRVRSARRSSQISIKSQQGGGGGGGG